jgi:RHH-type rel operon transcriptional repressor/antitoxin RelB
MANIRFNQDIQDRLAFLAKETGRTMSYYIREAVESKIEDLEDIYLAEKALEALRAGKSSVVTWDSIKRENKI